jgi:hypothetical protein
MKLPIAECTVDNAWWWAQKMPETCRVLWQNKFWIFDVSSWLFYTKKQLNYSEYSNLSQFNPCHAAPIINQFTTCHTTTAPAQFTPYNIAATMKVHTMSHSSCTKTVHPMSHCSYPELVHPMSHYSSYLELVHSTSHCSYPELVHPTSHCSCPEASRSSTASHLSRKLPLIKLFAVFSP